MFETQITSKTIELDLTFSKTLSSHQQYMHGINFQMTQEAPSVASFKYRLNRNLMPPPNHYNVGSHKGQILKA